MPRYERHVGDEHRFFEIKLLPLGYFYRWGRIGEQSKEETQTFATVDAAKAEYANIINRNRGEYQLMPRIPAGPGQLQSSPAGALSRLLPSFLKGSRSASASFPDKELVAALLESPDDTLVWARAADECQKAGGRLAGRGTPPCSEDDVAIWGADLAECITIRTLIAQWRHGLVHRLFVGNNEYSNFEPGDVLAAALSVPACQLVTELALGVADVGAQDLGNCVKVLGSRRLETVTRISLLDDLEFDSFSWGATVGDLRKLWGALPNLEHVRIRSGSKMQLGKLDIPRAKSVVIETCGLAARNFAAISGAAWPLLEKLDVLFGGTDEKSGGTYSVDHVAALLQRKDIPKLSWLGLRNAEFTDSIIPLLSRSPLLPQLKTLDLSMGCLTDKGASEILSKQSAFAHLESLHVRQNVLSAESCAALGGVCGNVVVAGQRLDHFDEGERPSVVLWGNYP